MSDYTDRLNTDFHEDRADLQQVVGYTVGAASTCWENLYEAGVFESEKAVEISEALVDYIERHYEKRQRPNCTHCDAGSEHPTLPIEDDEPEVLRDCE